MLREVHNKSYEDICNLFSEYIEGSHCYKHNIPWNAGHSVEQGWIVSNNDIIAHSKLVNE